ncbi:VCBS repeat-containing protein [Caldilinea sp.]|uniref:FG-GAP repeat domain-containing protein n=1 Tax=Caldilinea sp. TaxID=2293560 RepID=UPI002CD36218|nr:VCBS repeat-containing protein [Caldilinea sp.]HRA67732.1 VCBS repeat-containing protein [Caldilinea sp.]
MRNVVHLLRVWRLLPLMCATMLLTSCNNALALLLEGQGTYHNTATVADLNGDQRLDLFLHNLRNEDEFIAFSVATLWLDQGDGRFAATRMQEVNGSGLAAAVAEINQDGAPDLLVYTGHTLKVLLNQDEKAGQFEVGAVIDAPRKGDQYATLVQGDLNGDGWTDGVVAGCCGRLFALDADDQRPNFSWVWYSGPDDGRSAFAIRSAALPVLDGLAVRGAALGDLDIDGDLDLLITVDAPDGSGATSGRVYLNDGAGMFTDSGQQLDPTGGAVVALGDIDGDGALDALIGATPWLNQAGGWVQASQPLTAELIHHAFLADFDGDGDQDALLGSLRQAVLWRNDGHDLFTAGEQRFSYSRRHALAIGDLDEDGLPDIIAAAYTDDYRIWYNQGDGAFSALFTTAR